MQKAYPKKGIQKEKRESECNSNSRLVIIKQRKIESASPELENNSFNLQGYSLVSLMVYLQSSS